MIPSDLVLIATEHAGPHFVARKRLEGANSSSGLHPLQAARRGLLDIVPVLNAETSSGDDGKPRRPFKQLCIHVRHADNGGSLVFIKFDTDPTHCAMEHLDVPTHVEIKLDVEAHLTVRR